VYQPINAAQIFDNNAKFPPSLNAQSHAPQAWTINAHADVQNVPATTGEIVHAAFLIWLIPLRKA